MNDENKTCKNCKYMRQHYAIGYDGTFVKLNNVTDCIHGKITKKQSKKFFKENESCQYWENIELKTQENEEKIKNTLKWICKRLDKIIQILESNNSK